MANSLNTSCTVAGNVNGLNISQNSNTAATPAGSTAFAESVLVNTGAYQLIVTGSNFGTASVIYVANTSPSASISLAISSSGGVSSLGTISPIGTSTNNAGTLIQWNNTFVGLYASATTVSGYGVFAVITS